jgi:hypothetical protein
VLIAETSYSSAVDFDDDDGEPITIYFMPLTTEDTIETDVDVDKTKHKNQKDDKMHQQTTTVSLNLFISHLCK